VLGFLPFDRIMGLSEKCDVIVVGAGPAGSTAAKLLADRGYHVLLIDRAAFPRHKTCASWINRLAFERFPYLASQLEELIEAPFYGITFYDRALAREGHFAEAKPSGYLSLRSKFDDGLRRIAVKAGVEFLGGRGVTHLDEGRNEVRVRLADGQEFASRVVVGADGASSRVAVAAGLRKGWQARDYVLCANADIPCEPERIRATYGERFPFRVYLEYDGIEGYGWVFPKRRHICVGIGGRMVDNRGIRRLFSKFFSELQERGHLPVELRAEGITFDIDPVGAVHHMPSLTRGRAMLIGDAAGFVSGSTGEGIYPGMVSGEVASQTIHRALTQISPVEGLARFNGAWRSELASYVKRLPGGDQQGKTQGRIDLIFRSPFVARVAGRIFLYGERLSLGTLARSLWTTG
jgi:geranylgeranyl reductase family protein